MTRSGSTVVIKYNGTDITSHVLFESCSFESQMSGIAGSFEITLKDTARSLGPFVTGKEVTFDIDGVRMFGGFVMQVARKFAFPVDRTDAERGGVPAVKSRQWVLRGVDYNILFDKRVLRYSSALTGAGFLRQLPSFWNDDDAGYLVEKLWNNYIDNGIVSVVRDINGGYVDSIGPVIPWEAPHTRGAWIQQGLPVRQQMDDFTQFNGGIYYIDPSKNLHVHGIESMNARWGFSDVPNHLPLTTDPAIKASDQFQGATYGFREIDAAEDGTMIINDAMIWGGSEWAGTSGGTLFARRQNAGSIADHGRWQLGETHFGEDSYGIQAGVDARAEVIVNGTPSGRENQQYGFRYPQWQFRFAWFGHDAPTYNGSRDHLKAGQLVTIILFSFGEDLQHPLVQTLPLRTVRVTFPELDPSGNGYVKFEGMFGIQVSDPWTLWKYLLKSRNKVKLLTVAAVSNTSETSPYGGIGSFAPMESPDGSRRTFTIYYTPDGTPTAIGYIPGTTAVYVNGSLVRNNSDYTESDPENGQITFSVAPRATDWLWIQCRTMSA